MIPTAASLVQPSTLPILSYTSRRTFFGNLGWSKKKKTPEASIPVDHLRDEYLKKKKPSTGGLVRGDLASSSIFEDEEVAGPKPAALKDGGGQAVIARNPAIMAAALDPDPSSRQRWERKMVIREITRRGRLSKAEVIKKSERVLLSKSHNFQTSVKKLMRLAQQVAGKTVEEAIVQMRFSKKKAARDVRQHLEHARNEAIVRRGMGLGKVKGEGAGFHPVNIMTKDGKRVKVSDPTNLYIEQAWVGKGDYGITPDHRARGQINMMQNPSTRKYSRCRPEGRV